MMSATAKQTSKYTLMLAAGAICISFAPVFVKLLLNEGMGPTVIGQWRLIFGGLIFFLLVISLGGSVKISGASVKWALIAGTLFAADIFVWHKSILYVGAGMATILGNMQVFGVSLMGRILYQERLSKVFKLAVPLALVGVALLTGVGSEIEFSGRYALGVFFGLSTAVFYTFYLISLKSSARVILEQTEPQENHLSEGHLSEGHLSEGRRRLLGIATLLGWVSLSSALLLSGAAALEGEALLAPTPLAWGYSLALAGVAQVLGWLLIYRSLAELPASRSGLILLLQPTFATLWGALFFAETLTMLQLCGATLTLGAIYLGGARKS